MNDFIIINETHTSPIVSVAMLTYNHERYIVEAIESVLMQKTDFPIQLVIAEDGSSDHTRSLILEYQQKYPEIIKLILQKKNVGANQNNIDLLQNLDGKYVAALEGDDYWIDSLKLQNFIEANSYYSNKRGHVQLREEGKLTNINENGHQKKDFKIKDFFTKNNLVTCTMVFRNYKINSEYLKNVYFGDWMLYVDILNSFPNSKAYVSEECYSVYRINESGAMAQLEGIKSDQKHFSQIEKINHFFKPDYSDKDISIINGYSINIYKYFLIQHELRKALNIFWRHFKLIHFKIPFRKYLSYFRYRKQLT